MILPKVAHGGPSLFVRQLRTVRLVPFPVLALSSASKDPPAEPGALVMWPLEAAVGAADAAP